MGISNAPELGIVMEGSLLISVISRVSLRRQIVNLRAVNLHGQHPSPIPASKVSQVTVNRDLL